MSNCKTIVWSEELTVNEGRIDNQHKEIFEIINSFVFENEINSGAAKLAELLSKLTDYSLVHFKEEEYYMKVNKFPHIAEHRALHKYYIKKVALFNLNYSNIIPTNSDEVCKFLIKWWIKHILEQDFKYKLHIDQIR